MVERRTSLWGNLFLCSILLSGVALTAQLAHAQKIVGPFSPVPASGQPEIIPGQIVVRFRADASQQAIDNLQAAAGTRTVKRHSHSRLHRLGFPPNVPVDRILDVYRRHPLVEEVGPNFIVRASFVPNDTHYSLQWHMKNTTGGMWAEGAWDLSTKKGQGVVVAVIDSGVAYENFPPFTRAADLQFKTFVHPWDFFNNDGHANDDNGHGTHVTGTIAQDTNSNPPYGVAGVAYNSTIMPLKVLNYDGSGAEDDLVEALHYAIDHGARVVNLSLGIAGSGAPDPVSGLPCTEFVGLNAALDRAYDDNVIVVAAAGNESATTVSCPAAYPKVIAVGATRYDGQIAPYSNSGNALVISAPGGDPNVDQNADGWSDGVLQETFCYDAFTLFVYYELFGFNLYGEFCDVWYSGTSMASPHVAGTVALLLGEKAELTSAQVRDYLVSTARDRGAAGWDPIYGAGVLDARAALAKLNPSPPPPPLALLHIGDLDGSSTRTKTTWRARVTVAVHKADHTAIGGVVVTGSWSNGASGTASCTTGSNGTCTLQSSSLPRTTLSATFAVTGAVLSGYTYENGSNHDIDFGTNGTTITVNRP